MSLVRIIPVGTLVEYATVECGYLLGWTTRIIYDDDTKGLFGYRIRTFEGELETRISEGVRVAQIDLDITRLVSL